MPKRVAWIVGALMIAAFLFFKGFRAPRRFELGDFKLTIPKGWREVRRIPDRVVISSPDQRQQATISTMELNKNVNGEIFGVICRDRLAAERQELRDGVISPDSPTPIKRGNSFFFFYSGVDKDDGRVFSTYMTFKEKDVLTIYLEGLGVAPEEHGAEFKAIVASLK